MWRKALVVLFGCLSSFGLFAQAWTVESLSEALEARSEEDRGRDAARQPADVLVSTGIARGMTVMDLVSTGGWYTEVLSIAVGDEGVVYAQNRPAFLEFRDGFYQKALSARLADGRLANVQRIDADVAEAGLEPGSLDAAFTALNLHDVYFMGSEDDAVQFLSTVKNLLKPGGFIVVIDHHGAEGADNASLHRMTEAQARTVIEAAGLDIVAAPETLRRPDDDLTLFVFDANIRGKTDRFVLVAAKPAE